MSSPLHVSYARIPFNFHHEGLPAPSHDSPPLQGALFVMSTTAAKINNTTFSLILAASPSANNPHTPLAESFLFCRRIYSTISPATTMKAYKHLGTTALPLLGLLVANSMPTTTARSDTITVDSSGTTFSVKRYDDGRNEPYTVTFTKDSVQSTYTFNTAGFVTDIVVGSETYEVLYESNGDLTEVNLTSYRRKRSLQAKPGDELPSAGRTNLPVDLASGEQAGDEKLVVGDGGGADGALKSSYHPRLLTIACDDCIEAWDAVCDEGVPSVCELVDYGAPISSAAEASIDIMCEVTKATVEGGEGGEY